jgi:hypothetical protein
VGIYVEIPISGSMDELWEKTQNPQLHQRWDLRFNQIEYFLARPPNPRNSFTALELASASQSMGMERAPGPETVTAERVPRV